ncbi:MAG TPA: DnaJ domain-containing protein [Bryobacteraceae bacterium]|nr:DnaJ domain-containing protein [Bryobacteraceae bacterium]HXJ41180.1 DnaJ domain-containing protein [Bryobacteraceae bacterium]
MSDKRRKQRQLFDCALEVTWKDSQAGSRTIAVQAIDLSDSGIRVESSERIDLHTEVFVRAERYGLTGTTEVRHCGRRGSKYVLGLEFHPDTAVADTAESEPFVDYYELLQISPNAEPETIHRVFRIMASRYHPDNKETGDNEKFLLLTKAHAVLSDAAKRASYESAHRNQRVQPLPVFGLKEFAEGLEGEVNRRLGILSLLYNRRRTNPENPGISMLEFETVMSFPREHLEFAIWFLQEKQYIRPGNHSDYCIAAAGVEHLESEVPSKGILSKLLHAPQSPVGGAATKEAGSATEDPGHALALVRAR